MSNLIIDLNNVGKWYKNANGKRVDALKGVTLRIREGEFVSIMGPSGSGKTTLANIIGLLSLQSEGRVKFLDYEIKDIPDWLQTKLRRAYLGFIFQDYMLIEHMNAIDNVMLALNISNHPRRKIRARAEELLIRVGLKQHLKKYPRQLSGGQKQRVAIARALLKKPKLILADEPAGALDPNSRREVLGLLQELNTENGSTIVMVTHNAEDALAGTRLIKMRDARLDSDAIIKNRHNFRLGA
jgi:ABC-type lipoprotein export system ATPase subunit